MKKKSNKKTWIIVAVIAAVVLIAGGVVAWKMSDRQGEVAEEPTPKPKKRISVPANIIALADRPEAELIPFAQRGRNLRVQINNIPMGGAETAEYLIEYSVGQTTAKSASGADIKVPEAEMVTGIQGSMGEIDLSKLPAISELLLGTCSAGGACTHHSGLSTGALTITYQVAEPYATRQTFDYFEKLTAGQAQTADGIFNLAGDTLARATDFVIINAAGLPSGLTATPITMADPESDDARSNIPVAYQIAFTTAPAAGPASATFTLDPATTVGEATIYAYDYATKTWSPLETEAAGSGVFSATDAKIHDLYVLAQ